MIIAMQIKSIGIDLGKTTFHLVALGTRSQVVVRKKFSGPQRLAFTANLPWCLLGMEAGVGLHFLGRALREQGHEVRLIPAQFVRPFVKSNKNDSRDAEAIAEAVEREHMRFVPIQTEDQLDLQARHRVREGLVSRRTSVINQIRAFLLERGISFRKGPARLRRQMPEILENADEGRKHSQTACPRTCVVIRFLTTAAIIKDGHARIIIMRPETILPVSYTHLRAHETRHD